MRIFRKICIVFVMIIIVVSCVETFCLSSEDVKSCYKSSTEIVDDKNDILNQPNSKSIFVFMNGTCTSCIVYLKFFENFILNQSDEQGIRWFFCYNLKNEYDFTNRINHTVLSDKQNCYFLRFHEYKSDFTEEGTLKVVTKGRVLQKYYVITFDQVVGLLENQSFKQLFQ